MGRFDIRETTTRDRAPEPDRELQRDRGPKPGRAPERPGHRRNYDPRRPKQDITERMNAAVADVGGRTEPGDRNLRRVPDAGRVSGGSIAGLSEGQRATRSLRRTLGWF